MISKLLGWVALTAGLAAFALAPVATAGAQQEDENVNFYKFYEGNFDAEPNEDDWFYDSYAFDSQAPAAIPYASYDAESDRFEWEEDGLFA